MPQSFCFAFTSVLTCSAKLKSKRTAEIEEVRVEERLPVELLDVDDGGALQAAAEGLLGATLVRHEGLQHGPHHVQLHRGRHRSKGYWLIGHLILQCSPISTLYHSCRFSSPMQKGSLTET